ncbi:hypothetical protein TELCIR_04797 [Teladorsagia circumcincta]|uniref:ATP-dependent DNA helicase n=1 Tax=Teladorsagia circumcincta TaxID=45464 RepID=A0A2G9USK6_TELCI|nr:hypothetical protein TELCIR_04797 [Teladorsagia circumcincta]
MVFEESRERGLSRRRYVIPTANEVAVIYVGEEDDVPLTRSLALHLRRPAGDHLRNIRDIDKICDPLTYPLLFPTGAGGWDPSITNTLGGRITQKGYYSYLFSVRDSFNPILYAGKLCQQFAVDAYVKIEQNRLNYQRQNQLNLRADYYSGLQDYVAGEDANGPPGRRVILPSSYIGSPRSMQQSFQDAMAIVARFGKPTYFLTVTCNPQWKEIQDDLFDGQTPSHRPDLTSRVFHAKLMELCTDLLSMCLAKCRQSMFEDYIHQGMDLELAVSLAYFDVQDRMSLLGVDLTRSVMPPARERPLSPATVTDYAAHDRNGLSQYETLNSMQKAAADSIFAALDGTGSTYIYVDGPGGSGKTYLHNTVYNIAVGRRYKVLCVAWTGLAANLLPAGRTVNSTFKLNIGDGNRTSTMRRQQTEAQQLTATDLIIWDEISRTPKVALEAVDALMRDLTQLSTPFGGKVVVLGGDFRQILPVVENGRREDIIEACVRNSSLWSLFTIHRLNSNMSIQTGESGWHTRLLEIGNGDANDSDDEVSVPSTMLRTTGIVDEIFGAVIDPDNTSQLCEYAILAPKNIHVRQLNEQAIDRLRVLNPEDERCYRSIDEAIYTEGQNEQLFSMEYLNTLTPTGMPPHEHLLKWGTIVMLLRNLDVANGLCNGTRLIIERMGRYTPACRFFCGERRGQLAVIPRINNYCEKRTPFCLRRRQFPIRVAFAMTINKAQGQSFSKVGIYLPEEVFSHGQLYVALSRAKTPEGIKIESPSTCLKNIVYTEVLM